MTEHRVWGSSGRVEYRVGLTMADGGGREPVIDGAGAVHVGGLCMCAMHCSAADNGQFSQLKQGRHEYE